MGVKPGWDAGSGRRHTIRIDRVTIKNKIFISGALFFLVFVVLAVMSVRIHHEVNSNLRARDKVNQDLAGIQASIKWKNNMIGLIADIVAQEHVPPKSLERFKLPFGHALPGYEILAKSGRQLVEVIAVKEQASTRIEQDFRETRETINRIYRQLDKKIATRLAIVQLDQILGDNVLEQNTLAPYVLKSLNQLTLVALNVLISKEFSDNARHMVMKNQQVISSQLRLMDPDGSIADLFAELFGRVNALDRLIIESRQRLSHFDSQILQAKNNFDQAVNETALDTVVTKVESKLLSANQKLQEVSQLSLTMTVLFLFLVPFLVIVTGISGLNSVILHPISHLINAMKGIKEGRFDVTVPVRAKDEIGELAWAFNAMAAEIKTKVLEMSQLNHKLRENESKYKTLVNNLPQRIFLKDRNFAFISCNRHFAGDVNMTEEEIVGKNDFDLYPEELAAKYRADDQRILQARGPEEIKESYLKNGKKIIVQTVKTPVWDDKGEVFGVLGIFWDITRQMEMEASMRQARFIIDKAPIGIWRIGNNGDIVDVNEQGCKSLGYTRDELCRMAVSDFDLNAKTNLLEESLDYLRETGTSVIESLHQRKDGRICPIQVTSRMMTFEDQEFSVAFVQDISERKEMELALKENEQRLDLALSGANEGIWDWHIEQKQVFFDNRFYTLAGYEPGEFPETLEEWRSRIHADDLKDVYSIIDQYLAGGQDSYKAEFRFLRKNNSYMWVQAKGKIVSRDDQGKALRFIGTQTDITRQKQDEEELGRLRNFLTNIINSMPSMLVAVDKDGNITQWNNRAEKITGVMFKDAFGRPLRQVYPRLAGEMARINISIRERRVISVPKVACKTGQENRFETVTIYPLVTNGVDGAVIRIDDVTEQVRLEEMMVQSEKMLSVGGLAAGMAHEINNPLAGMIQTANVMKSRLENLEMRANLDAAREVGLRLDQIRSFMHKRGVLRMLTAITESGWRAAEIVDNMLSFARKSNAAFSSHDPAQLLDRILELAATDYDLKRQYDFKNIKIIKEYEHNLPMIACEGVKIQQVLLNILRNGAQAMQLQDMGKRYQPCFSLRLAREENMLRIEIEDNGPGMDSKTQSRIFEPFFTTKPVGIGTGLGLSVSYFIVTQNHGGTMDVSSSPGKGSNFIIRLPLEHKGTQGVQN